MRKVLFYTNIPSPYRVDFFNELGKYCDLTVSYEVESAKDRDSNWKHDEARNYKEVYWKGIRYQADRAFCPGAVKLLKQKWDNIVVCGYASPTFIRLITYMRRRKNKFFIEVDGGFPAEDQGFKKKLKNFLVSSASGYMSTGKVTTDFLCNMGADREQCHVYPFSSVKAGDIISLAQIKELKEENRKALGINEEHVILFAGQFIHRKGIDVLLKAVANLPGNYGIYIIGGEATEEYKALAAEVKNAKVYFPGFKVSAELEKYYYAADVFVLPTREDIWGLVVNEALAKGLPVITTDKCIAGIEMLSKGKENASQDGAKAPGVAAEGAMAKVAGGTVPGKLVPVDDVEALRKAIISVCESSDYEAMCEAAVKKAAEYTIEKMAEKHLEIFEEFT